LGRVFQDMPPGKIIEEIAFLRKNSLLDEGIL